MTREGPLSSDTDRLRAAEERLWDLHHRFIARSGHKAGTDDDVCFLALALAGEVGEVANIIKKSWRGDGLNLPNLYDELSDVFAYWVLLVYAVGATAEEIVTRSVTKAEAKIAKLEARRGNTP